MLAVDLKILPPARPLDVGILFVHSKSHSRRYRLLRSRYFIDMYVGMMYSAGGVRKINQSKKCLLFSSIAVNLFINEPQQKPRQY
jgi:hypothetical protein